MTNYTSYKKWLIKNDISRPHLSGRWRLLWRDIYVVNVHGISLSVGGFFKEKPTKKEHEFFCKWRDSAEFQHKTNLVGFLRFCFSKRHLIEDGQNRARQIAVFVHQALVEFANGNEDAGIQASHDAWCKYMIVKHVSYLPLIHKGITKQRQEETIRNAQPLGVEASKVKAKNRKDKLHKAMRDYINNFPNAVVLGHRGLLEFIKNNNLTSEYKDSSIKQYAKSLFKDKRRAMKAERK